MIEKIKNFLFNRELIGLTKFQRTIVYSFFDGSIRKP